MDKENKKLAPGDVGYPGGTTFATARVGGKTKEIRVTKDAYGNVVYVGERNKIFGLF